MLIDEKIEETLDRVAQAMKFCGKSNPTVFRSKNSLHLQR